MEMPKNMLTQIQQMQQQYMEAQEALKKETVIGGAGGGAVRILLTGDQRCTEVHIDPALLKDGDAVLLQDLVLTALNTALDSSRQLAIQKLGPLADMLNR
ncbi:MAG: YbaB/EbfC family nucleoid-associated protein [Anaerolineae bacterium]|nr:MAG: YbaB/EbfC family nucleoid-associated protein [Anaerolineae bacterium]